MAIIPRKLSFQLHFRNKLKTRKTFSRNFRLQRLLKKHFNNSSGFYYPLVKKEKQKNLLKSPSYITAPSLKIKSQERTFTKKVKHFSKTLKNNLLFLGLLESCHNKKNPIGLIKPNKNIYTYKKKTFFKSSWFLINKVTVNNNYHINSNIQFTKSPVDYNVLKLQQFLSLPLDKGRLFTKESTDLLSNRNNSLNNVLKSNCIFLKKRGTFLKRARANKLLFGRYGICFKQYSIISSKCAETAKLDIAKILRKKGRFWIRICCDTPISARPAETRMGKGKGSISYWAAKVNPGQLFFEFSGVSLVQLKEIYETLCKKSAASLKMIY